jgi:hypothetical protein
MALELLHPQGAYLDGEEKLASAAADYVAGQPAKVTATGLDIALTPATVSGLMKNDKSIDANAKVGPQVGDTPDQSDLRCTTVHGTIKVKMTPGRTLAGTTVTPFVYPGTGGGGWAKGDKLYVNSAGKWDNAAQTGGDPDFGTVTKAPASATDSLEAHMNPMYFKG